MAARLPTPVADLQFRPPVQGRLRMGKKTVSRKGKEMAVSIGAWRVTSADRTAMDRVAELYGGEVRPWSDGPREGEWEVFTAASELRVILPPDPLGGSPGYEHWSGGGCLRRCAGLRLPPDGPGGGCLVPVANAEGAEMAEVDCQCRVEGVLTCKLKTRLSVILADVPFGGVWRLDTNSELAAEELPGMVQAARQWMLRGMPYAMLGITFRSSSGGRKQYRVPVLRMPETPEALVAGAGQLRAIDAGGPTSPTAAALPAADESPELARPAPPATPIDVEAIDVDFGQSPTAPDPEAVRAKQRIMFALIEKAGLAPDDRHGFALAASKGRTDRTTGLTDHEWGRLLGALEAIQSGGYRYQGVDDQGRAIVVPVG